MSMRSQYRIALTEGPGGGKTTAADLFRRELGALDLGAIGTVLDQDALGRGGLEFFAFRHGSGLRAQAEHVADRIAQLGAV